MRRTNDCFTHQHFCHSISFIHRCSPRLVSLTIGVRLRSPKRQLQPTVGERGCKQYPQSSISIFALSCESSRMAVSLHPTVCRVVVECVSWLVRAVQCLHHYLHMHIVCAACKKKVRKKRTYLVSMFFFGKSIVFFFDNCCNWFGSAFVQTLESRSIL